MKIRTQFIISMVVFSVILLVIATTVIVTNQRVDETNRQEQIARKLEQEANELSYLSSAYLLYHESQQLSRWESKATSFSNTLSGLNLGAPEQRAVVSNIRTNLERLRAVFTEVRATLEIASQSRGNGLEPVFIQVSWSRMEVQNQGMIFDATRLAQMLRDQADELQKLRTVLSLALLSMLGAFLIVNYVLTYRRILKSILDLQAGTTVIGSGNLDYAIAVKRNDEIGDLSRAFNRMTSSLKGVTASKAELEKEIAEHMKAEERIHHQNAILNGINTILQSALTSETEEALGHACLAVAQEVTQSKFGFIGEINAQGGLDDIAISDLGWDACRMENPTGHRQVTGFKIHGIHGRVLQDGKGFFTNDPTAHPDSIGIPEGHPPIKAFLGAPLTHGGRTIGMVALGGREDGYREEDLDSLGNLALVIVQALMHNRAEAEREHLHEEMERRANEVSAVNKELEAFAYSVSHDLRAPQRRIEGFSRMLLEDNASSLDDRGRMFLDLLHQESRSMAQLIDGMLALSRITRSDMHWEQVDLSALALSIAAELQRTDPERGVQFLIGPAMAARGDARLLRALLENLLGNAWKFTSRHPTATIEFSAYDEAGKTIFFVRDDGAGFDAAYADKLFTPFQRLHGDDEFPGTGIGLATVQRIIHRHGGRIWAEGQIEQGATFFFVL